MALRLQLHLAMESGMDIKSAVPALEKSGFHLYPPTIFFVGTFFAREHNPWTTNVQYLTKYDRR